MTRAQFAAMIRKAFEKKNKVRDAINFRDISKTYWAYTAIREAYEMGFLGAVSGSQFNPAQRLTRLDILTALTRGLDYSVTGESARVLQVYSDHAAIPANARNIIAAATQRGLVVSYPNVNSLNLNQVATRAEVAAFIYQALVSTGEVTAIASPYVVGSTQVSSQTQVNTDVTTGGTVTQTGGTTSETVTQTGGTTSETVTQTEGTTSGAQTQTDSAVSVVTLSNGYRISYLGMTPGSGTSTWRYRMEELPSAQDLSNWVLGLPSCAKLVSATPKGEVVNPDPNAKISGVKWQPGGGFTQGEFTVTLSGELAVGTVDVAAKGPDVARGTITGPSCGR